ncbi:TRAP transporter small permease [Marinobacterium arenosum]|uniref:TRAP transporter small permease n=1 Tax=Marinobacterium arenosum TaxID=2862496 RepID=UPI001C9674E7|nr:TRAP transporter small permease [Marinobacterium arenosum]MBY4677525.1 TRAP transporter small permease [Marinobacterium arenosum]
MNQPIKQHPVGPVGTDSYSYDPELSDHDTPEHLTSLFHPDPGPIERKLIKLEALFDKAFRALMIFAGLALAGLMFGQVILRYVLESPFAGMEEMSILLGVWVYFLGMGYATRVREHIHGGVVSLVLKDPFKIRLIRFIGSCICIIAACAFGFFAIKYALFVIDKGRLSLYMQWPKGLWSASMIVGFAMMAGYFLLQAVAEFRDLMRHRAQRHGNVVPDHQSVGS